MQEMFVTFIKYEWDLSLLFEELESCFLSETTVIKIPTFRDHFQRFCEEFKDRNSLKPFPNTFEQFQKISDEFLKTFEHFPYSK